MGSLGDPDKPLWNQRIPEPLPSENDPRWLKELRGERDKAMALRDRIQELEAWKESASAVLGSIDLHEIGKVLGVPLGELVGPQILPRIKALQAYVTKLEATALNVEEN